MTDPKLANIFGYGSLLGDRVSADSKYGAPKLCRLPGFRRTWNVAMQNSMDQPGYKFYVEPETRGRPDVYVAFLNLVRDPSSTVNGLVFSVDASELDALDSRERNYYRLEVTHDLSERAPGRVWTYVGTQVAEQRFRTGMSTGRAAIPKEYFDRVFGDFRSLGPEAFEEFLQSTDDPACEVRPLDRVDLR